METLKIDGEYITLQQFLKIENMIASGGESKFFLQTNLVYVNQVPETRRGRKLYPNDVVKVLGKEYLLK